MKKKCIQTLSTLAGGGLRTNQLEKDPLYEIVWSAFVYNDGEVVEGS